MGIINSREKVESTRIVFKSVIITGRKELALCVRPPHLHLVYCHPAIKVGTALETQFQHIARPIIVGNLKRLHVVDILRFYRFLQLHPFLATTTTSTTISTLAYIRRALLSHKSTLKLYPYFLHLNHSFCTKVDGKCDGSVTSRRNGVGIPAAGFVDNVQGVHWSVQLAVLVEDRGCPGRGAQCRVAEKLWGAHFAFWLLKCV